jgi:dTDP-4-amino-4,6-dideoxygalactose transaminase
MNWRVPLSDLDFDSAEREAAIKVIESKWLTMGGVTQQFEEAFAEMVGARHAIAVSNATAGLHLAVRALGCGPGDEIILPSLTFVATANALLYQGTQPVFCDIAGERDFSISPGAIEASITSKTMGIMVMHYGGYLCDMPAILEIATSHDLRIIEDAAHAPGTSLNGKYAGTWGDVGVFSFFSNKNMATGEGGMVTTDDDELAEKLRLLRSHGMTSLSWDRHKGHAFSYDVVELGYNCRFDEIRAAIGLAQLGKLEAGNTRRREIIGMYQSQLGELEGISIPYRNHPGISSGHLFPILLDADLDRGIFMAAMREAGIQTSIHYPPIHTFSYYRDTFGDLELPLTEAIGGREVTLPLFPRMSDEQVNWVVEAVHRSLEQTRG